MKYLIIKNTVDKINKTINVSCNESAIPAACPTGSEAHMLNRRDMLLAMGRLPFWCGAAFGTTYTMVSPLWAEIRKRLVPKGTVPERLRNANPRYLDTRNLDVMPLDTLESVGDDEAPFEPATWRLNVGGNVSRRVSLTLDEIRSMPPREINALLICSGVFAFHGRWKGITLAQITKAALPSERVKACIIYGHSKSGDRTERFKLSRLGREGLLLAYGVNGQPLGNRHGFPLRVVAPGRWGERWVKYVKKIEFV